MAENSIPKNPNSEWALYYSSYGLSVVPVSRCAKVPAIPWAPCQQERASEEVITNWFDHLYRDAGVGIVTGAVSGIFVVDVDEGPGKPGGNTLQELQLAHGYLTETWTVKTGGGGRHFYFKTPGGVRIKTGTDILGPGIDVRGDGGYVVAPPSVHPNGKPYKWDSRLCPGECEIAEAPDWLIKLVRSDSQISAPTTNSSQQFDVSGKRIDGREELMRDLVWKRMVDEHRDCPIPPSGVATESIVDELWATYQSRCAPRGQSLEADGRGRAQIKEKVEYALQQWGGKLAEAAASEVQDQTVQGAIQELARLPKAEYEVCRKEEAKRLNMRQSVLDKLVEEARGSPDDDDNLGLFEPEPSDGPVDGIELLDDLVADIRRYVILPLNAAEVLALWVVHTHVFECWRHTPRLHVTAPEKGCGKSTLLDVLARLVPRALKTEHLSPAVLFRIIDSTQPTLLIDEVDTFIKDNEELRGCLDAGHAHGGRHLRCVGDNHDVRGFKTFAPAALAGIGKLPGTLADRSIPILLQRRSPDEPVDDFRADRAGHLLQRASQIARWVQDNSTTLAAAEPEMPDGIHNRLADNWRPLFAIADVAGGEWPGRVRAAAVAFNNTAGDEAETTKIKLLSDIRDSFQSLGKDKLSSEQIVNRLHEMEDRPWPEYGRSAKPISKNQVARLLKPFGISPGTIRDGETTFKGYRLSGFKEAFTAYLPPTNVTPSQTAEIQEFLPNQTVTSPENVTVGKAQNPKETAGCDGVTVEKGGVASVPPLEERIASNAAIQSGGWRGRI